MKKTNQWEELPLLLSTKEMAILLCLTPSTVRKLRRENKLKSIKLNNKNYLFDKNEIEKIVKGDSK